MALNTTPTLLFLLFKRDIELLRERKAEENLERRREALARRSIHRTHQTIPASKTPEKPLYDGGIAR
jgi:hypothetical protein